MVHRMSAAETSRELRRLLEGQPVGDGALLRVVRQYVMDVEHAGQDQQRALLNSIPLSTRDLRWDALLAGVTEDLAFRFGLPVPGWTLAKDKFLMNWWFVSPFADAHPIVFRESPAALANRGVFLRRAALENV